MMAGLLSRFAQEEKGMYLIEMLVTISLIGIVAALAVPRFNSSIDDMQLQKAAKLTAATLKAAQTKALSGEEHTVSLKVTNPASMEVLNSAGTVVERVSLEGAVFTQPSSNIDLVFDNLGNPDAELEIELQASPATGVRYDIGVTQVGQVTIEKD